MGFASAQISVGTTGHTPLFVTGDGTGTTFTQTSGSVSDPLPAIIENTDATNPVYLGGPGVTSSNGFLLKAGAALPVTFVGTDANYLCAVSTGGSVVVGVLIGRQ